jgi:hypothetical protein
LEVFSFATFVRFVPAPENPTAEDTSPVKEAVVPWSVPARVTPPAALIPAENDCSALNDCVIPRPAIVVEVVGKVTVAEPEPESVTLPPVTDNVREVVPPEMSNPSTLLVISRFTDDCFAIFCPEGVFSSPSI